MRNIQSGRGSITVVIWVDVCAGPACKRVTNRHGEKSKTAVVRATGTPEKAERGRIPARPPRFLCWVSTVIVARHFQIVRERFGDFEWNGNPSREKIYNEFKVKYGNDWKKTGKIASSFHIQRAELFFSAEEKGGGKDLGKGPGIFHASPCPAQVQGTSEKMLRRNSSEPTAHF